MTEQSTQPGSINTQPTVDGDASAASDAQSAQAPPEFRLAPQEVRKARRKRRRLAGVLGVAILAVLLVGGIPWAEEMLNTVSTDDAYVPRSPSPGLSAGASGTRQ